MTQLEQLKTVLLREIKQKEWMKDNHKNGNLTTSYFMGAIAALRYILYILDKLINNKDNG
jgi:hypothetical protein